MSITLLVLTQTSCLATVAGGKPVSTPVVAAAPASVPAIDPAKFDAAVAEAAKHTNFKVVIITRQNKLDDLIQAMNMIGVTGVTITNVLGCGVQKVLPASIVVPSLR